MGGCQNYGPVLGALNIRCRIVIGIQKRDHTFDNNPPGTLISDDIGLNIRANHNISVRRKMSNFHTTQHSAWMGQNFPQANME